MTPPPDRAPASAPSGRPRVYLCPGDDGWAVNEDRRLTAAALDPLVTFVDSPRDAEFIHACWWEPLMALPASALEGKHVVCHMVGDPARVMSEPAFLPALRRVRTWVAQSRGAAAKMRLLVDDVGFVPYAVDADSYASPALPPGPAVARALASIPPGRYVIFSLQRDTTGASFGPGMDTPKLVKGPDLLLEVLTELHRRGAPVTALLAGPRRHWVRTRLRDAGVHTVFAGEETPDDDYPANALPASDIAHLLKASHLSLTTSRSEGGPRGVLEAAAAGVAQLSTPVGHAPDILHHGSLFSDPIDGADRIERDIADGSLRALAPAAGATVRCVHTVEANRVKWARLYGRLAGVVAPGPRRGFATAWIDLARKPVPPVASRSRRVAFWNRFTPPPWGGGNQFMTALMLEARRQGVDAAPNDQHERPDAHVLNSVQFEIDRFRERVAPGSAPVLHRIDGPISLLRGTSDALDQDRACFEINRAYATATVIQSWHTLRALHELGFAPVNPALVTNACDPALFHAGSPPGGAGTPRPGPLRVIATAWSPNVGKGARVFEWIDEHLDPSRYAFTFVGNTPAKLRHASVVPAQPSGELAELLRRHDVYLAASRNDPCSNALIEALACGLPALYLESGGHPEIVQFAGLPFTHPAEIPGLLDRLALHLDTYRRLIRIPTIAEICGCYLRLLFAPGV